MILLTVLSYIYFAFGQTDLKVGMPFFNFDPLPSSFMDVKDHGGNGEYHPHRRYNANLEDVVKMTTDIKLFDFGIGRDVRRCESVARLVRTIKLVKFPCFDIRFALPDGLGYIFWIIFGNKIFNVIRI